VRALIAFAELFERAAPPGVHRAATLAAWIVDLDPDDERLTRALRLVADGEWRQLGGGHGARGGGVAACVAGLQRPVRLGGAQPMGCAGWGAPDHRRHGAADATPAERAWQPLDPQRDALLPDLDWELSQAGPIHDRDVGRILDAADQEQSGEAEQP